MAGRRLVVILLVLALLAQPAGAASLLHAEAQTDNRIVRTMTFALTPEEPGSVDVRISYRIPESVAELDSAVPASGTLEATDGFDPDGTGNVSWDGRTETPSFTVSLPVNRTGSYRYDRGFSGSKGQSNESGLLFVDTGPWALVSVPPVSVWWASYRDHSRPTFERRTETAGPGVAGSRMVYLGNHTTATRTVDDQVLRLVVPRAASLEPAPGDIFDSIEHASASLPVGSKPEASLLVAAPTGVDWGPRGLTEGSDAWVLADQPLDDPDNVWVHEYVHVRQDFTTTDDARWILEAMGEYYAALFTLEEGRIGYAEFRDHLSEGTHSRYETTVLSEPETWGELGQYAKGGLVFGDLDRRMRLETDGSHPGSDLFRAMNGRDTPVDHAFVRRTVGSLAGEEPASALDRYVRTTASPGMWSQSAHGAAFDTLPPRIVTEVAPSIEISGPYRNRSVDDPPTLVPEERLTFTVHVRNDGEATGDYQVGLLVNGSQGASANGTLAGGERTDVTLTHEFQETGNVAIDLESATWNVSVVEPARPVVTDLSTPDGPFTVGERVPVNIVTSNPADRPASGTIPVRVDGDTVDQVAPRLDAGSSAEHTVEVAIAEAGEHEIVVGEKRVVLAVGTEERTPTSETQPPSVGNETPTEVGGTVPGPGMPLTFGIVILAIALASRYEGT